MAAANEPMPEASQPEPPVVVDLVGNEGRMLAEDLERARVLLRDGMGKIANFVSVLQRSAEMAHELAQSQHGSSGLTQALSNLQAEANQAMMGLQLEDILGQLIEGTRARVGAFSQLSTALAELVAQRPSLAPSMHSLAGELKAVKDGRQNSTVRQGALEASEVDLF